MTCRTKAKTAHESSEVKIPSRPSNIYVKLDELIGQVVGAAMGAGAILVLVGAAYLMDGSLVIGTIVGLIGAFVVYYAH